MAIEQKLQQVLETAGAKAAAFTLGVGGMTGWAIFLDAGYKIAGTTYLVVMTIVLIRKEIRKYKEDKNKKKGETKKKE